MKLGKATMALMLVSVLAPAARASTPRLALGHRFEANRGQLDPRIRFLARGIRHGLFLTPYGATLTLKRPGAAPAVLSMHLHGGRAVEPDGAGQLPGRSNYLVGARSSWHTDVPSFERVRYHDVRPGVDVEFHGTDDDRAEYDLVLSPSADPASLALDFEGVQTIRVDSDGSAVLTLAGGGELRKAPPVAYQEHGRGGRALVAARYQRRGARQLGFSVGRYDRRRPLVIDPVFVYSTLLGGLGREVGQAIAVDGAGNAYVVGYTMSANFPTATPVQATNKNSADGTVFISKLGTSGAPSLIYSTYLGGSAPAPGDRAFGVAVDAAGNAYVTGGTAAFDFPVVTGGVQTTFHGIQDAFVAKLGPTGSTLAYSTFLGGSADDFGSGIAVDASGNAYVTGQTASADFPVQVGSFSTTKASATDFATVFVSKLNPTGSALLYSTFLGGTTEELAGDIAIDPAGNAYVTGTAESSDFPTRVPIQAAFAGLFDGFVTKLNPTGSALVYSTFLGGTDSDFANGIALDGTGAAYVVGSTASTNFPTKLPLQSRSSAAGFTVFVSKISSAGTSLTWSTYLGGTVEEFGNAIATDAAGNAYVTGYTSSPDFRVVSSMQTLTGLQNAFVSELNAAGSALTYSTLLGGAATDSGAGIAVDGAGNAYVTGQSFSWNFPTPGTALQPFLSGDSDAFVVKLAASGNFPPVKPKTRSDAIVLTASAATAATCGGVAFDSTRTLAVTDQNADGLVCPGCTGSSYAPADALDLIKVAFYGVHHDAAHTRNCGSDVRRTLVASYGNLFQGSCPGGTCAGKPLHHLWRLNEGSGSIDTFNQLLGATTAQFCNVGTATVVASVGTDFLDNDPIRVTCDGTGKTGEQVCGSAFDGHAHNLGLLLPIFIPDGNDTSATYPVNFCTPGAIALLPATKATYTGLCPAGNPSFGGKCFSSVFRTTDTDGNPTTDANCVQYFQTGACPTLVPAGTDCRGANLWLRNADGTIVKDTTFAPGVVPPLAGRLFTGAYYRVHGSATEPNGTGFCTSSQSVSDQISCLVGTADPCSVGFVTRSALVPVPAAVTRLAVKGVVPDDAGVYYGTYPLSF